MEGGGGDVGDTPLFRRESAVLFPLPFEFGMVKDLGGGLLKVGRLAGGRLLSSRSSSSVTFSNCPAVSASPSPTSESSSSSELFDDDDDFEDFE